MSAPVPRRGRAVWAASGLAAAGLMAMVWLAAPQPGADAPGQAPARTAGPAADRSPAHPPGPTAAPSTEGTATDPPPARPASAPAAPPRAIDNAAIRRALASNDVTALEAAFRDLERCGRLRGLRSVEGPRETDPSSTALRQQLKAQLAAEEAFCAGAEHALVSRRGDLARSALQRVFSPALAESFYLAGPMSHWDELQLRPEDPLVVAWHQEARYWLERAARQGDLSAMESLRALHGSGPAALRDPVAALGYQLASTEIGLHRRTAHPEGPSVRWARQQLAALPPDDRARAQAQARQLLQGCCADIPRGPLTGP